MHFNGHKLTGALEEFSITSQLFWAQKCKNQNLKNKGFECSFFFQIEVHVISNLSSQLEKKPHQTPEFLLMNYVFMIFFKKLIFRIFQYFQK